MEENKELSNWEVYRNFTQRNEKFLSQPKRFWQFVLIMAVNGVVVSVLPFGLIIKTLIGIMLSLSGVAIVQLRADIFENMREVKVMFSLYVMVNVVLSVGLVAALWLS